MALTYRLNDPNFTIYHRAALGGLAATIQSWDNNLPAGIHQPTLTADGVTITWDESISAQDAIQRILEASFKLTEDKLIHLPGQFIGEDAVDLRLAVHEGLCLTFLQHNKMRPGEKGTRTFPLKSVDGDGCDQISYKAVNSYAHQKAQGTGLLDELKKGERGFLPAIATIPQSVIPGAMTGRKSLQATPEEAFLLLYLMVSCVVFLLRPRTYRGKADRTAKEKAQACVVVPEVTNLLDFSDAIQFLPATNAEKRKELFSFTYLGRVVGGAEEAALSFLADLEASKIAKSSSSGIAGCQAIAMGKVAWDKNQINRSISVRLHGSYPEIKIFRTAKQYLGRSKLIKTADGRSFALPNSPVPELIAANLAAERHWCAHFQELVSEKKDFNQMSYHRAGLNQMAKVIKDDDDKAIIQAFQQAWRMTMGQIGERAENNHLNFERLMEVRREKIRNEILRTKTPAALAGWFLRFCADATKGASLAPIREDADRIRAFIFSPRYFDRFQNLLLFALLSYVGDNGSNTQSTQK
ncbi:CRISPR-associated protein [Neosynechococcus sphagnicola sy1]|uniref:CRISPR-associated protein n=1 Tax=Neosynechococcus sphagnicola sy1 TaxID=1497020 RepID=A0A098TK41_9CYAN|nr:type I-MYXAN CRISPR-associated Cas8a1/Cmx1 [Neosynechococcus sphagnicola]KGF72641.1 CRISPR-associated protein [Neosynechococcus sphagnicola sy1]